MSEITKTTVLRTSARLDRDEWVEFKSGPRTTFVVTRARLEFFAGGGERWEFIVYGHRKESREASAGQIACRDIRYSSADGGRLPSTLYPLFLELYS